MTSFWLKYEGTRESEKRLKAAGLQLAAHAWSLPTGISLTFCQYFPNKHKTHLPEKITTCRKDTASHLQCPFFPSSLVRGPGPWPAWHGRLSTSLAARCGQGFSCCQQDLRTKSETELLGSVPSSSLASGVPMSWLYLWPPSWTGDLGFHPGDGRA